MYDGMYEVGTNIYVVGENVAESILNRRRIHFTGWCQNSCLPVVKAICHSGDLVVPNHYMEARIGMMLAITASVGGEDGLVRETSQLDAHTDMIVIGSEVTIQTTLERQLMSGHSSMSVPNWLKSLSLIQL